MLDRRVNFIEAEVARIDPLERKVTIAHGEVEGNLSYDYLIFALGRRLATERIPGFYEHAHHLLNVDKAIQFGKAVVQFHEGRAIIGQCLGARLPVPVYETAFTLARLLKARGDRGRITVVSPNSLESELGDPDAAVAVKKAFDTHEIEFLPGPAVESVMPNSAITNTGYALDFNLLMLAPPFRGSSAASYVGITNDEGYINVDGTMRVMGQARIYAVGDCVNFSGPKLGHMAVRQGAVAAINVIAEIVGHEPVAEYSHEMRLVIDADGSDSTYLHKDIWTDEPATIRQGRFWSWAKRAQKEYWEVSHS
jgi:sulfide:quinone oxidoreductase